MQSRSRVNHNFIWILDTNCPRSVLPILEGGLLVLLLGRTCFNDSIYVVESRYLENCHPSPSKTPGACIYLIINPPPQNLLAMPRAYERPYLGL